MSASHCRQAIIALALAAVPVLSAVPEAIAQQTGRIQGQVADNTLRPLVGAQVFIPGTNLGTLTDARGQYLLLNVPAGAHTVRVQMIGFAAANQDVTVAAGETATANFELRISALALDEIVVTGLGQATERRQLSASVAVITEAEIQRAPVQTLDQLLQGRVAGATVNAVSAQPGTASLLNFRGTSSVFGSQTPVIYVDGVRVDNAQSTAAGTGGEQSSALAELLTSDIERIEITRGGAAATLYGSDAATGVIQIFTRRGTPGAPRVTARIEQGVDVPELKYILDAGMIYPSRVQAGEVPADFFAREFFQTGHAQAYNLNVSGGGADVVYSISGRIQHSEGVQPKNESDVFNLRGTVHAQLSDRLRAQFSGGYVRSNFGRLYNGTAIADPITALEVGDAMFFTGADNLRDALDIFLMPDIDERVNRFQFSTGFQYRIADRLNTRFTIGLDHRGNQQRSFHPIGFTAGDEEGSLNRYQRDFTSVTLDAAATYAYPTHGNITSSLTVGVQGFRDNTSIIGAFGRGFALPGSKDFGEAADISAFEANSQVFTGGFIVDEQIGLWNRLFVNLGVRVDAGTSFGDDVEFATYPKVGLAYDLSEEEFIRYAAGWVDAFRLRAAYGQTGKFPPPFLRDRTFDAVSFRGESAPRFDNPGNVDLKPEVTSTLEAGFEVALLDNRVGVDFTYYMAETQDALFFVPEQPATGQGTQIRNVGRIENKGVEVDVNVHVLNRPNVSWHVGATFQTVDNKVTDMGGVADFSVFSSGGSNQRVSEGHTVGAWYVTTPIDTNGDGLPDASELRFSGKGPTPTRSGSVSTRLDLYRNVQISALADWAGGHEVFDWGSVWATFNGIRRREVVQCPPMGDPNCELDWRFPIRYNLAGEPIGRYGQSLARSAFLLRGDYIKVREISARYALPANFANQFGVANASIYGSIRNVAIFTPSSNKLVDPELAGIVGGGLQLGGITSITVSPPRAFRFGLELGF